MNLEPSKDWYYTAQMRKITPWIIEERVRRICFGSPGYIDEWQYYSGHDTREEAQLELDRLNLLKDDKPLTSTMYRISDGREQLWNVRYS